jgi:hypothetical protein
MHWLFPLALALEHNWTPKDAVLFARGNQAVDSMTHCAANAELGAMLPNPTQAEIRDGLYGALEHGFHAIHKQLVKWHFPGAKNGVAGPCVQQVFPDLHGRIMPAREILQLGMDCHRILDSHSHESFYGYVNIFNRAAKGDLDNKPLKNRILAWMQPDRFATGHSEYGSLPDTIGVVWKRNGKTRDNKTIFLNAGIGMWNMLCSQTGEVPLQFPLSMREVESLPSCIQSLARRRSPKDFEADMCGIIVARMGKVPSYSNLTPSEGDLWEAFVEHA